MAKFLNGPISSLTPSLANMKLLHVELVLTFCYYWAHAVAQLAEALRYKPEGRGFDSRWGHWDFSLN
jgi:hypothetical protein